MPSSKPKDATTLKQTTLFDSLASSSKSPASSKPTRRSHRMKTSSISEEKRATYDSDSEELAAIQFTPVDEPGTEEDDPPVKPPRRKRLLRVSVVDSDNEEAKSEETSGRLPRAQMSSDEEDEAPPKKKTRLQRRKQSDAISSSDEDIAKLVQEVDENQIVDTRLRTRNQPTSKFQQNLEILKRRKRKLLEDPNSATEDRAEFASEEDDGISAKPIKGSRPSEDYDEDDDDADASSADSESDFIVEDDNSSAIQLPPEFSMETHENIAHQFKKIFQFFVHVAVQDPSRRAKYMEGKIRDEQYFSVPLQVMRRKLFGLRDSLVASSVWRPEFKQPLQRYPELEMVRLDFAVPSCDACHLGGRMSTLLGRLGGPTYKASGFNSDFVEDNTPPEFHLGRFCARRTRVFHDFSHWEYKLFQNIAWEIDSLREGSSSRTFHRIAYAGGSEPPDDLRDADGLCDWLDSRRIIETEWHKVNTMMENARSLEMDHKRGDVDD